MVNLRDDGQHVLIDERDGGGGEHAQVFGGRRSLEGVLSSSSVPLGLDGREFAAGAGHVRERRWLNGTVQFQTLFRRSAQALAVFVRAASSHSDIERKTISSSPSPPPRYAHPRLKVRRYLPLLLHCC